MLFIEDPKKNINLKKIQEMQNHFGHHQGVVCSSCQKPLTNEESMIAGMGAICLERVRFTEYVSRDKLMELEGVREPINKGLYPARTAILREKSEPLPRYITVLSVTPLESLVIDRTEMNEVYEKSGSMSEAIAASLYSFVPMEGESIAPAVTPKNPEVVREFKKFQKELRGVYKERTQYLAANPNHTYYTQVTSRKGLTDEQTKVREDLLAQKNTHPDFFNNGWSRGSFHRATWIYRLQHTQLSEAKLLASVLSADSERLADVAVQDYGLTDAEILTGLQHSGQLMEKNLFKAFIDGNKNLFLLLELYKKHKELVDNEKMLALRIFSKVSNQEPFSENEKTTLVNFLTRIKISPKLFNA